jgi:hypothetical protein
VQVTKKTNTCALEKVTVTQKKKKTENSELIKMQKDVQTKNSVLLGTLSAISQSLTLMFSPPATGA